MITCNKCGTENPLGRVFCGKCGSKLDLTRMTSQTVTEIEHVSWIRMHWLKLIVVLVLVIVLVLGLSFVSNTGAIGKPGTALMGRQTEGKLKALAGAQPGKPMSAELTEEEINAQLEASKDKMGAEYAGVSLKKGFFDARMVTRIGPIPIGSYNFGPQVSYDLRCGLASNGKVEVVKASMGKLPLGPAKSIAINAVLKALAKNKDWPVFTSLSDIKVDDGKMTVTVKK